MRILLSPLGSFGDVNPFIGLGLALQQRGHEVVVITNAYFEPVIKRLGVAFSSCGPAQSYIDLLRHPERLHPETNLALFFRFCLAAIPEAFARIQQLYRPGSTVMVAEPHAFAARIAQESLGIPLATVTPSPIMLRTAHVTGPGSTSLESWLRKWEWRMRFRHYDQRFDTLLAADINSFRAKLGLKPVRRVWVWQNSPQRVIGLWPEWLYGPRPDWPRNSLVTGFIEYDGTSGDASVDSPDCAIDTSGQRPIVFTAGTATAYLDGPEVFAVACEACEILNWPGLLLAQQENPLGKPLPPLVRHIRYAPLGRVLSQAAAIVHPGGIGTAARALKAGIPQLIVPGAKDGFLNARLLVSLGVARSIGLNQFTPEKVAAQLRELLHSEIILARCGHYATGLQSTNALEVTCEYIEALKENRPANAEPKYREPDYDTVYVAT